MLCPAAANLTCRACVFVMQCEDPIAQALAVSLIPLDQIECTARETLLLNERLGVEQQLGQEDLVLQGLLRWFKTDFMKWVRSYRNYR